MPDAYCVILTTVASREAGRGVGRVDRTAPSSCVQITQVLKCLNTWKGPEPAHQRMDV